MQWVYMAKPNNRENSPSSDDDVIKFTDEAIGARLINAITSGLYDGNLNCIREYVQNGVDSEGVKNITIRLEKGGEDLVIKDDGKGMDRTLLRYALRIGFSEKGEDKVGWRGIGIWSGVSICKRIVIITKMENNEKLRVEIDNDIVSEGEEKNESILETLNRAVSHIKPETISKQDEPHYTIVRLESILRDHKGIFTEDNIKKYLEKTVPAPFNDNDFKFAKEINLWLKNNGVELQDVNITFNNKKIYRPPTKDNIFWDIVDKELFEVNGEPVAVGWFLTHNKNKIFDEANSGIYFKKKGFSVGDGTSVTKLLTKTYTRWQVGEIHIISKQLRENTARNGFERSPILDGFIDQIQKCFRDIEQQNKYQSDKNQNQNMNKVENLVERGKTKEADIILDEITDRLSSRKSYPDRPSLSPIKELIDASVAANKSTAKEIRATIKQKNKTEVTVSDEDFRDIILSGLSPKVRKKITKRIKTSGLTDPVIQITDSIEDALKDLSGLPDNEIGNLSKSIYGWDSVTTYGGSYNPLFVLDPIKDVPKDNKHRNRNLRFGAMIYTTHDLFSNLFKHEKGKPSLEWFEGATEAEQRKMVVEMVAVADLLCRMIEKSKKYQP